MAAVCPSKKHVVAASCCDYEIWEFFIKKNLWHSKVSVLYLAVTTLKDFSEKLKLGNYKGAQRTREPNTKFNGPEWVN